MIGAAAIVAFVQVSSLTDDPLAADLFTVLVRLVKRGQHEAMAITSQYDLTLTQLRLLYLLDHGGEAPLSTLADAVGLSLAATGRAVDAMHRGHLVTRTEDASDRRVKRIALAPRGREAVDLITRARFGVVNEFVAALDPTERARLTDAVRTLDELGAIHLPPVPEVCEHPEHQRTDRSSRPTEQPV